MSKKRREHVSVEPEEAQERSRQQAMAARVKSNRTKMSVGQANVQRLKQGNQPRGGR